MPKPRKIEIENNVDWKQSKAKFSDVSYRIFLTEENQFWKQKCTKLAQHYTV